MLKTSCFFFFFFFFLFFCFTWFSTKKRIHVFKDRKVPKHADRFLLFVIYFVRLRLTSNIRTSLEVNIKKTSLFKHTENFTTKKWKFSDKNSDIFHISTQNTDCGYSLEPPRRGGSNEYPQSMFLSRNKKNNVYPCKPQFYSIKVGFKGVKII